MPRGLPDYYNPDTLVSQRLANVEEVVTAIRGISGIDNRGRTLFSDDFGEGLSGWLFLTSNDGEDAVAVTAQALVPPASAFLDAGTLGGEGSSYIYKPFQLGASSKLGIEASFLYTDHAPDILIFMFYNLSGTRYAARMAVSPVTGDVEIEISTGYVSVGSVGYNGVINGPWLSLKLVADFVNGKYVRALIGQTQIDLSDYSLIPAAVARPGETSFWVQCRAGRAVTNDGYVGHVAGTVDEP